MRFKRLISAVLSMTIIMGMLAIPGLNNSANVSAATNYNLNTYSPFNSRTKNEIAERYYAVTAMEPSSNNRYTTQASTSAPYNAGVLSDDTHEAIFAMLNYVRWLVGAKDNIQVNYGSSALQAGALLRNFQFDHNISRSNMPADLPDSIWNLGSNVSHNIISMGTGPQGSIINFINEGYRIRSQTADTIGHRFFLLSYRTSGFNFGYSGSIEMGVRTGNSNTTTLPFLTFPAAGYCPNNIVEPGYASWTVELNSSMLTFSSLNDITITITNLDTNQTYTRTAANGGLRYNSYYTMLDFNQPEDYVGYSYGNNKYRVNITGLKTASGAAATAEYTVEFFNPADYANSSVASIKLPNGKQNVQIGSDSVEAANAACGALSNTVIVVMENGREVELPVDGAWRVNTTGHYFYNSVSASRLPQYCVDTNNVLREIRIPYDVEYVGYSYQPDEIIVQSGSSKSFKFFTYWTGFEDINLYFIPNNSNTATIVANRNSSNVTIDGNSVEFSFSNLRTSDSGTYFFQYNHPYTSSLYISAPFVLTVGTPTPTPTTAPTTAPTTRPTTSPTTRPTGTQQGGTTAGGNATVPSTAPTTAPSGSGNSGSGNPNPNQTPSSEGGVAGFVERLYTIALGRPSDPNGKSDWVNRVYMSGATGADVAQGFLFSPEFLNMNMSNEDFLAVLYRVFFDRPGDAGGVNYWLTQMADGMDKQTVIWGFINSTEWANVCLRFGIASGGNGVPNIAVEPSDGIIEFATRLYTTCLGRPADQNGLMDWARQLANRQISGSQAAAGFFTSSEFVNANYDNAEYINRLYLTFMGRPADQGGFNYWMSRFADGASREDVFNGFAGSNEWAEICSNYGILK